MSGQTPFGSVEQWSGNSGHERNMDVVDEDPSFSIYGNSNEQQTFLGSIECYLIFFRHLSQLYCLFFQIALNSIKALKGFRIGSDSIVLIMFEFTSSQRQTTF